MNTLSRAVLGFTLSLQLAMTGASAASLSAERKQLDVAMLRVDITELERLEQVFATADSDWAGYYRALVQFRLGELAGDDKKRAKKYLNACIDTLDEVIRVQADNAEALALQASCYGTSSAYYMLRAATRGMAADKAMERAKAAAADNPRVMMQDAISLLYRPAAFGGDKVKARQTFEAAAQRFAEAAKPAGDEPNWGEAETWWYLGGIYRDAGDTDAARRALEKSLELAPEYRAAQKDLAAITP